jgi:hypothetical protein
VQPKGDWHAQSERNVSESERQPFRSGIVPHDTHGAGGKACEAPRPAERRGADEGEVTHLIAKRYADSGIQRSNGFQ